MNNRPAKVRWDRFDDLVLLGLFTSPFIVLMLTACFQ